MDPDNGHDSRASDFVGMLPYIPDSDTEPDAGETPGDQSDARNGS